MLCIYFADNSVAQSNIDAPSSVYIGTVCFSTVTLGLIIIFITDLPTFQSNIKELKNNITDFTERLQNWTSGTEEALTLHNYMEYDCPIYQYEQ